MRKQAFTLIELVMVIAILGILAAVAIPRFIDLSGQAEEAAEEGVVGSVRSGVYTYYAEWRDFPLTLDTAGNGPAGVTYTYDPLDGSFE